MSDIMEVDVMNFRVYLKLGPITIRCTKIVSHITTFSIVLLTPMNNYHVFNLSKFTQVYSSHKYYIFSKSHLIHGCDFSWQYCCVIYIRTHSYQSFSGTPYHVWTNLNSLLSIGYVLRCQKYSYHLLKIGNYLQYNLFGF